MEEAPVGRDWLHEVKYDGYRLQCLVNGTRVKLATRSGADWTDRFPGVAAWFARRGWRGTILDGEVVVIGPDGRSDFQLLQARLGEAEVDVTLYAFDLLRHADRDLTDRPLVERKSMLRRLLRRPGKREVVRYSTHIVGKGPQVFHESCRHGMEGIIAKRRDARYTSGRSRSWLKIKCINQQECIAIGFTRPKGSREHLGALLVAVRDTSGALRYVGRVGSGLSVPLLRQLHERLSGERRRGSPVTPAPAVPAGTVWVNPVVVIEVRFTEWTSDGLLRHPTFLGVREDKMPAQVKREVPQHDGLNTLSHPDKVLYPEQGITKRDLARYYESVAALMLPHVAGRPLSLVRCPDGQKGSCFYQKHLSGKFPEALQRVLIRQSDGMRPYGVVEDVDGLIALVQIGALELHVWGARADRVDAPDRMVFDLDPGQGVTWGMICDAADEVRRLLRETGLESWVKTSGGKGVHVVVPIERRASWEQVSSFARAVAQALEAHAPERYVSRASKAARPGRIFIDWLRNTRGATAVAAWSTRARPGAPVSLPCEWSSLRQLGQADSVTVASVRDAGVPSPRDPWKAMLSTRQRLRLAVA